MGTTLSDSGEFFPIGREMGYKKNHRPVLRAMHRATKSVLRYTKVSYALAE